MHLRFNCSIFGSDGFTRTMLHCKSSLQCFASLFRCLHARQADGRHELSSSSFQWTLSTAHFCHECLSFSLSLSLSLPLCARHCNFNRERERENRKFTYQEQPKLHQVFLPLRLLQLVSLQLLAPLSTGYRSTDLQDIPHSTVQ